MQDVNDELFRRLVGAEETPEESPEEVESRQERLRSGEGTVGDLFAELPSATKRTEKEYLERYGLNPRFTEEEELHSEGAFELMSEEQRKQYGRAQDAYLKRNLPLKSKDDSLSNLQSFAATNPPEVLRKHVWRLQRGLDEPLFGRAPDQEEKRNSVSRYYAAIAVSLCDSCASELKRETEESGAEHVDFYKRREGDFYDPNGPASAGFYLFKFGEMFVERKARGFFANFPLRAPGECTRCGANDVDLWREHYGSA